MGNAHRRRDRRRRFRQLVEISREVTREIVERAAGRNHVDEPEQRGAELAIGGGKFDRSRVQRPERMPRARWKCRRQLLAELARAALDGFALEAQAPPAPGAAGTAGGGVARSIASHPRSCARSASSAATPPRSPN